MRYFSIWEAELPAIVTFWLHGQLDGLHADCYRPADS